MNSIRTEDYSQTKSSEAKEIVDEDDKDEAGFVCVKEKKRKKENYFELTPKKYNGDQCFLRNIFEKYGSLYLFDNNNRSVYITKIRIVNFPMNKDIFEKGKKEKVSEEFLNNIPDIKFWHQRYYYYSKFDEGIMMDYESWYSVTPEELGTYISLAVTNKNSVVVDAFCGSGGNVIQFSKNCKFVYAVDIDPGKISICKNNCKLYNCEDNIEFILSDFLLLENKLKADYIFLSPPWGGVEYKDSEYYSIKQMMTPNIYDIVRVCLSIGKKIIFYLPRTTLVGELFEIIKDVVKNTKKGYAVETMFMDVHVLNSANKIKAVMLIFGFDDKDINAQDIRHYLKFNYRSIKENQIHKLINIHKVIGSLKFFRTEYAFRKNFSDSNLICSSALTNSPSVLNSMLKYYECEILSDNQLEELHYLNIQILSRKNSQEMERTKLPYKLKTYFVNGKVMTEEEYHQYKDNNISNQLI